QKLNAKNVLPNTLVFSQAELPGIEYFIIQAQLRWTGHLVQMPHHCIPHQIFFGQLKERRRHLGAPRKCFKDFLKSNLKKCHIEPQQLETLASDRQKWHERCRSGLQGFEAERILELNQKWEWHTAKITLQASNHICLHCNRSCVSRAGLLAHVR
uniref:C2H2-type domain-containing protein n=1 Tax=Latimeria chalumnae TaxID=7897 RepID=H2ZYK9_LATCH